MSASVTPNSQSSAVPWWKEPTKDQWYAYIAAWLGWTLDAFDFTIFLLIMVPIAQEFGVPITAVAIVFTLTLWMRLVGATTAGWLGDRIGRKAPLMISILWYSLCNFIAGFSPTFSSGLGVLSVRGISLCPRPPAMSTTAADWGLTSSTSSSTIRSMIRMSSSTHGRWRMIAVRMYSRRARRLSERRATLGCRFMIVSTVPSRSADCSTARRMSPSVTVPSSRPVSSQTRTIFTGFSWMIFAAWRILAVGGTVFDRARCHDDAKYKHAANQRKRRKWRPPASASAP